MRRIGLSELCRDPAEVVDAVTTGERVLLMLDGAPVAEIVPHVGRPRWLRGTDVRDQLRGRSADSHLSAELDDAVGRTLGELYI